MGIENRDRRMLARIACLVAVGLALCQAFPTSEQALVELDAAPAPAPAAAPSPPAAASGGAASGGAATGVVSWTVMDKFKTEADTTMKGLKASLATEAKERQTDNVKSAAAIKQLQAKISQVVASRNKEVAKETAVDTNLKTLLGKVGQQEKSDIAATNAAVSKQDATAQSVSRSVTTAATAAADKLKALTQSVNTKLAAAKKEVNSKNAKVVADISKSNQEVESQVSSLSDNLKTTVKKTEKDFKDQRASLAVQSKKVAALQAAVKKMTSGTVSKDVVTTPKPAAPAAKAAATRL